jgi:hypothetical protein
MQAAMVLVFFFLFAIVAYIVCGIRRDTTNHFEQDNASTPIAMTALIVGEIGGSRSYWPDSLQANSFRQRTLSQSQPR